MPHNGNYSTILCFPVDPLDGRLQLYIVHFVLYTPKWVQCCCLVVTWLVPHETAAVSAHVHCKWSIVNVSEHSRSAPPPLFCYVVHGMLTDTRRSIVTGVHTTWLSSFCLLALDLDMVYSLFFNLRFIALGFTSGASMLPRCSSLKRIK